MLDATSHVSMAPKISPRYAIWWVKVHPRDIGMDEDDDEEEEKNCEGSSEDDMYQVNNPIHDILV